MNDLGVTLVKDVVNVAGSVVCRNAKTNGGGEAEYDRCNNTGKLYGTNEHEHGNQKSDKYKCNDNAADTKNSCDNVDNSSIGGGG